MKNAGWLLAAALMMAGLAGCSANDYDIRGTWTFVAVVSTGIVTGFMECAGTKESGTITGTLFDQNVEAVGTYAVEEENVVITFTSGMTNNLGGIMEGIFTEADTMAGTWSDAQASGTWHGSRWPEGWVAE